MRPFLNQASSKQSELLLQHIIATFEASLAMMWVPRTNALYACTSGEESAAVESGALQEFLSGFYYESLDQGKEIAPITIDNISTDSSIPGALAEIFEAKSLDKLIVAPVLNQRSIKAILGIGMAADNDSEIDFDLLELLAQSALQLELIDLPAIDRHGESATHDNASKILPYQKAKENSLKEFEKDYFSQLIEKWGGNITKVAREAKVSRKTIYNVLARHGLDRFEMMGRPVVKNNKKLSEVEH